MRKAIEQARNQVATLLGAEHATEIVLPPVRPANSTVLLSAVEALPDRRTLITNAVEHPAVLECANTWSVRGTRSTASVSTRLWSMSDLAAYEPGDDVALVSVMWANNETGTLFPVEQMAQMARRRLFHTGDAGRWRQAADQHGAIGD